MMRKILNFLFIFLCLSLISCKNLNDSEEKSYTITLSNPDIKNRAFEFAKLYAESDTEYECGGQSPVRTVKKIDCSGLVIMCYKYALVDTKFTLLENDMTSSYMYEYASEKTLSPERGDLIFMGEVGTNKITHIAIYDKEENGEIYFIDSTQNETVNGVTERHYEKTSEKIKSFGIMKLKY